MACSWSHVSRAPQFLEHSCSTLRISSYAGVTAGHSAGSQDMYMLKQELAHYMAGLAEFCIQKLMYRTSFVPQG